MTTYEVCGIRLRSPIIVGSGLVTDNERNIQRYLQEGAGAVVTKTIHPRPPKGNREKVISIPTGWLNSTTYSQRSVDEWLSILYKLAAEDAPVMASVHADSPEELATLARAVKKTGCRSLELGISCLNESDGLVDTPERVARYVRAVRQAVDLPFSVKLSIGDALKDRVDAAVREGAGAITLSDTILGLVVDPCTSEIRLGGAFGYSGPGIRPLVLASIYALRKDGVKVPILGSGGVMTAADAMEYLCIGANAVQIYSVLHTKGGAVDEIVADLAEFLAGRPLSTVIGSSYQLENSSC